MYQDVLLFIDGEWRGSASGKTMPIINPATEETIGNLAFAGDSDIETAAQAANRAFASWRNVPALERSDILRGAARRLREQIEEISLVLTQEQGKPLAQSRAECTVSAEILEWFAEEGRRAYGRIIPSRNPAIQQLVYKVPVGPVAAFSPWNFPMAQAVRKIGGALSAGCTIVLKGPEETPGSCARLVETLRQAGLPAGVVNLVFGDPASISNYLIPHPTVRKISFTGSTVVGKKLAALAGEHMKRMTMELGGHAPALIFEDADIVAASQKLALAKSRNAGQVCVAPSRFLVQESVASHFLDRFSQDFGQIVVGNGLDDSSQMGPLANDRRLTAMEELVADATKKGAKLRIGGSRVGNKGYFFAPTILTDVPVEARIMSEEPFGPIAVVNTFSDFAEGMAEANRLPYGLGAYVYTRSAALAARAEAGIESGMVSVNHHGLGVPETPFGGVRDSGYGSEGGSEAIEAYLVSKFVSQTGLTA